MTSTLDSVPSLPSASGARDDSLRAYDSGLLILRLALGLIMAVHGAQKLFGWFGGYGLEGTGQYFTESGYPAGKAMAVVAGLTETLGGLGLAVGLITPLAAAAILGTMINAVVLRWSGGFFAPEGFEYEILLAAGAGALALTGPGRLAVDRFLPVLRTHRLTHGIAAVALGVVTAGFILIIRN
ncbi:DoxX family protein [Streptomyces chryseus]